jgi:ABC-type transporter Mla subunit MlaD
VVALLPKLTDLAGLGAGVGATYLGLGETMGVVKLATSGLSQALAGNKQALQSLTPEGRAFLQTLKQMRPELQQLRSVAQQGLFPGLGGLLGSVRAQMPQIKGIVGTVAGDAGNLGGFIGQQIAQPGFMRDLQSLADQGSRAFGGAARGAFSFGTALEQILIAAAPFTDWLSSAVDHLGQVAAQEALVARATGSMGDFFDRAKQSVQTLADVGKNVFGGLLGVLEAARGSGDSLWGSIDRVARRFDQWTNS